MASHYWLETLGCPKNQVDSDKLTGLLEREGYVAAASPEVADLVVVNTCAFIEAARAESIETILAMADQRREGSRLVVTGCMAERYGDQLAAELPEVDLVAGFGQDLISPVLSVPVTLGAAPKRSAFDLLELPRPAASAPWAYVKVAEGCDRHCGFCAIPSFRGKQRSRRLDDLLSEVDALGSGGHPVSEVVLVAQDLASYGRDVTFERHDGESITALVRAVSERVPWTRLLYLYPSGLTTELIEAIIATGVPYFDLSLQHVSRPLLAKMRRHGEGDQFLERIAAIRSAAPEATFRSSFILGYPGETEEDHDALLAFLDAAQLDWAGFFPFSPEEGTHAVGLDGQVDPGLARERLLECAERQDIITAARRDALVGSVLRVLVDAPGVARSVHEAPEIDGIITVPTALEVGTFADVEVTAAVGTDLVAEARPAALIA